VKFRRSFADSSTTRGAAFVPGVKASAGVAATVGPTVGPALDPDVAVVVAD